MTWFKVDDTLHSHIKVMRAGVEAMGLWVLAGSWAADQLTDGWVPSYVAQRIAANADELAAKLVKAGLWMPGEHDGDSGWWYHEWSERQPTRDEVLARRRADAERHARWRNGRKPNGDTAAAALDSKMVSRHDTPGDSDVEPRHESALPGPSRPDQKKKTSSNRRSDAAAAEASFDEFWMAYPRREAKKGARASFAKAVKEGTPAVTLVAGAQRYGAYVVAVSREREKIKLPTTWLNQGCWDDELDAAGLPPKVTGDPAEWLRGLWQAGDVKPIEKATRLRYEHPDLPPNVDGKQAVENFFRDNKRDWIEQNHAEILAQLNKDVAA